MKRTPLHQSHLKLNAKMVPFAGFEMPVRYSGILEEHRTVRTGVGIFDLSHMGEIRIAGSGAEPFLQRMTTNDVSRLGPGGAQYTLMCTEEGGILDDCVLNRNGRSFVLVVNAANIEKDLDWLQGHRMAGVELDNLSDETCLIAVQGPRSKPVLDALLTEPSPLDGLEFYHHLTLKVGDHEVICSRTGYTGELGYELYVAHDQGPRLWEMLLEAGEASGIRPAGLGARDTLRIEMKYCLYGNDIDETTNPMEAGLGWIVKLQKGPFMGSESMERIKSQGPSRKLIGFEMVGKAIPRKDYPILVDGVQRGQVTSGCHSPSLEKGIGMGYLSSDLTTPGRDIEIEIRGVATPARVVKTPFWKQGTASTF